ncbi:MAG: regulatory protein RecX [Nitrospirae bacterium]|nr:regulatory protein RecX [Nitrospirota bacterium]
MAGKSPRTASSAGRAGRRSPRQLAYRLLARRAYSERELEARLRRRGVAAAEIAATLDGLKRLGYLDDAATAAQWARSWRTYKGWGPLRVRAELTRRGLDRRLTDRVVADSFPDDETEAAAMQAAVRLAARPAFARAGRRRTLWLAAHLARRGFPPDLARRVAHRCCPKGEDDMMEPEG